MRAIVNSVDFYSSLSISELDTDEMRGSITIQACDEFKNKPNCEAIEIELRAFKLNEEVSFFSTLNYENALFLAKSILNILEYQKEKI